MSDRAKACRANAGLGICYRQRIDAWQRKGFGIWDLGSESLFGEFEIWGLGVQGLGMFRVSYSGGSRR